MPTDLIHRLGIAAPNYSRGGCAPPFFHAKRP